MSSRPPSQTAIDNLDDIRVMSRDEKMENIAAPGVPMVGDGGAKQAPAPKPKAEAHLFACGACQSAVDPTDNFCRVCGTALKQACSRCGAENQTGAFCSNCGKKLGGKNGKAKRARHTADSTQAG